MWMFVRVEFHAERFAVSLNVCAESRKSANSALLVAVCVCRGLCLVNGFHSQVTDGHSQKREHMGVVRKPT